MPGGCNFGVRPIDQHVKGFRAMGAEVTEGNFVHAAARGGRLSGANVYMDVVSVGATMNIMMAAVLADGHHHHRKRRQGATHRGSGQLPQLHGRRHQGCRNGFYPHQGRGAPQRRHLLHHPRPDRGGYLYGRCGRHRRTAADPQHHSQAHGLHLRQAHGNGRHGGGAGRHHAHPPQRAAAAGQRQDPPPTPASPRICSPRSRWRCVWPKAPVW